MNARLVELVADDRLAQIVVLVVRVHKRPVVDALLAFAKGVVKPSHEREVVTPEDPRRKPLAHAGRRLRRPAGHEPRAMSR